ncbi:MAG: pentapeptide repeat-containing protein [Anaerolineales bacterium]
MIEFKENYYEDQKFNNLVIDKKEIQGITFQNCTFNNCSFRETIFRMCKFRECTFKEGDLSLIQVDGSTFSRTRFEDLKLIGVNWVMGSWGKKEIQQSLKSLDFENCVLNYSTFMGLTLQRSLIRKCIAKEVDFSDADLKLADCTYTDFENSRFSNTDLTEADLRGATNYFIVPHLNILKKTKFSLPDALSLLYNLDIIINDPSENES